MTSETSMLGKYRIIRELGRSNDIVYEAIDSSINRRVALKELLLPPNLSGAQKRERIERFYREARAAGSLSHPNIVTIYEVGEDQGRHYIAMEFLEGQTLRALIDIEHALPVEKIISITTQICDALEYAHSNGVIHRDIKPDNIQILADNRVKLTDFGIARIMEEPSITIDGQVFGTPSYMSPEQVTGRALDSRSDIFSVGVVLYEMLTGRKPFTGDTVVSITYNIMNQDIIIPTGITAKFDRILRKCLSKNPDNRYKSAKELADDINSSSLDESSSSDIHTLSQLNSTILPNQTIGQYQNNPSSSTILNQSSNKIPKPIIKSTDNQTKYFIKSILIVLISVAALVGFISLIISGYKGFQNRQNMEQTARYLRTGQQYFQQKSYQAAIEQFIYALNSTQDPDISKITRRNIAVCYIQLGNEMANKGNMYQSMNYYRQAIETDPSFPEAYLNLGVAYRHLGNDDAAIEAWEKTIKVGYGSSAAQTAKEYIAITYHENGDFALSQGNKDAAIQWWKRAIEIAPGTTAGMMAQQKIDQVMLQ